MQKDLCFINESKVEIYHSEYYRLLVIEPCNFKLSCQVLDLITNEILTLSCDEFRLCNRKVISIAYKQNKKINVVSYEK